jgi:hypothetical protein
VLTRRPVCLLLLAPLLLAAGCGGGAGSTSTAGGAGSPPAGRAGSRAPKQARARSARRRRARRAHRLAGCPPAARALKGVYHPERLAVLDPCKEVSGRVALIRSPEEDGDLHFDVAVADKGLLRSGNYSGQEGLLVVEFMPRDFGHLPAPGVGDRVTLLGAWVDDTEHDWNEIHPVWGVSIDGGPLRRSGPQFGGDPAYARSSNALASCRTSSRAPCTGYGRGTASSGRVRRSGGGSARGGGGAHGGGCTPGYSPCIAPGPDVDCAGGGGGGPRYVSGPVQVAGSDPYRLDADHNGVGCE